MKELVLLVVMLNDQFNEWKSVCFTLIGMTRSAPATEGYPPCFILCYIPLNTTAGIMLDADAR